MIAEDLQNNPWLTKPTSQGGAGFDSQWHAGFHYPVRDALVQPKDSSRSMFTIRDVIEHRNDTGAAERVVYAESDDEVAASNGKRRLPEDMERGRANSWAAKQHSTLGAALAVTVPGSAMICEGQQILTWISVSSARLDWDNYDRFRGIWQLYADLIYLRRDRFDSTRGLRGQHVNVFRINDYDKRIAFHRWENGGPRDALWLS